MKTTSVPTYWAKIYVAYRRAEWNYVMDRLNDPENELREAVRNYVDRAGLCVTFSQTKYIYTGGEEEGCVIGLINYPRFPSTPDKIRGHAMAIATMAKKLMKQKRVTVEFPDETVMLGRMK
jgi:hypothetical protein